MDDVLLISTAVGFLLIFSAFFSSSETALTAVSRPYIHQLGQGGSHRTTLVARLQAKPSRLIVLGRLNEPSISTGLFS